MRPRKPRINPDEARTVCKLLITVFAVVGLIIASGLRFNLSSSHVPAGVYRASATDGAFAVGDTVVFNLDDLYALYPERADAHTLEFLVSRSLIKRVAALPGALIELSGDQLVVDGEDYPNSAIRPIYDDGENPCKVTYPHRVADGCVWLMADSKYSYDSRYFGDVPARIIRARAEAVLFW